MKYALKIVALIGRDWLSDRAGHLASITFTFIGFFSYRNDARIDNLGETFGDSR